MVIPVNEMSLDYAFAVKEKISNGGVRAAVSDGDATLGYKIRAAETQKIPYMARAGGFNNYEFLIR